MLFQHIYTNPEFQLRRTNCKAMVSPATSSISMQPRQASMRFSSPRELDAKVIGWLFPTNSQSMHRMMLMQNSWGKKFRPKWWNDKWLTAANGHADFFCFILCSMRQQEEFIHERLLGATNPRNWRHSIDFNHAQSTWCNMVQQPANSVASRKIHKYFPHKSDKPPESCAKTSKMEHTTEWLLLMTTSLILLNWKSHSLTWELSNATDQAQLHAQWVF